jgi:hypothetical protein
MAIYVFVKIERYKYRREDELESLHREGDVQKSSTISACDSYDQFYSGAPDGQNVVPIVNQTGSRRYIEPSSPDQLLYGAQRIYTMNAGYWSNSSTHTRRPPQPFTHTSVSY